MTLNLTIYDQRMWLKVRSYFIRVCCLGAVQQHFTRTASKLLFHKFSVILVVYISGLSQLWSLDVSKTETDFKKLHSATCVWQPLLSKTSFNEAKTPNSRVKDGQGGLT